MLKFKIQPVLNRNNFVPVLFLLPYHRLIEKGEWEVMKIKAGKAASVPGGLLLSLAVNTVITAFGTGIIALLLNRKNIAWSNTGYWIMTMILISAFTGGKVAISLVKTQRYLISLMSGLLYWMVLLCTTALFFGGQYSSFVETGALILSGAFAAALLHWPHTHNISQKRRCSYR